MNHRKWKPRYAGQKKEERRAPYSMLWKRHEAVKLFCTISMFPPLFVIPSQKKDVILLKAGQTTGSVRFNSRPQPFDNITVAEICYTYDGNNWIATGEEIDGLLDNMDGVDFMDEKQEEVTP